MTTLLLLLALGAAPAVERPNIVYVMSDELAYYEVGYLGHRELRTPRIDEMAREGVIFTNALAGSPVCAPLRATLMTGKHAGHASVRANDGGTPLVPGEETIASVLKRVGYATGGYGKWGNGGRGSTGVPEEHGFDDFFGYYDQVHAHTFFPPYLVRNSREVPLAGNAGGRRGETYSHYEIMREGLEFIRDHRERSFFAYFPITPPHGLYDIPDSDPAWAHYRDEPWPEEAKSYAAMVTMVDRNLGEILDLLEELGLDGKTLVFFTGDNGGQDRFPTRERPRGFFGPNVSPTTGVEFRGGKGDLYEGGLRIPAVARWPGRIAPGRTSDHVWYQPDILPTLAELAGAEVPEGVDGLSILPELLGEEVVGRKQERHEALYWEYRGQTAVRMGRWKAVRPAPEQPWELYDLEEDVSETESVALREPDRLREMTAFAEASHTPVVPGTYADRTAHEKDRWAKWGLAPRPGIAWPVPERALPREGRIRPQSFRVVSASSETRGEGPARYAFDDDPRTAWRASGVPGSGPQDLVIDLGDEYLVRGFHLLAPADEDPGGSVERCAFFVSNDPTSFGDAVADVDLRAVETPQSVAATPRTGRFVRLRVLSTFDATPEVALAELGVQGERPPARGGMDPTRRPPR